MKSREFLGWFWCHRGGSVSPLRPPCLELLIPVNTSGAFPSPLSHGCPFPAVLGWAHAQSPGAAGCLPVPDPFSSRAPSPRAVSVPGSPSGRFLGRFHSALSLFPLSVQLSVNSKPPSSEGQGDKKDNATAPPAPPSYEEATAGEGMKSGAFPAPPAAPLHPSWAYVDPSKSFHGPAGVSPGRGAEIPPGPERRGGTGIRGGLGMWCPARCRAELQP